MNQEGKKSNAPHILKAIASGLVWGLGQLFNKQFIKALFFFLFMVALVTIELITGSYFKEYDPYSDLNRFQGGTVEGNSAAYGFSDDFSDFSLPNEGLTKNADFNEYYTEYKKTHEVFGMKQLVEYTANNLKNNNPETYIDVLSYDKAKLSNSTNTYLRFEDAENATKTDKDYSSYEVLDISSEKDAIIIPATEVIYIARNTGKIYYEIKTGSGANAVSTYKAADGSEELSVKELFGYEKIVEGNATYYTKDGGTTKYERKAISTGSLETTLNYEFVNIANAEDRILESDFYDCYSFVKQRNFYANKLNTILYVEIVNSYNKNQKYYLNLTDFNPNIFPLKNGNLDDEKILNESTGLHTITIKNTLYQYNGKIYEYFNPRVNGYQETEFSKKLTDAINKRVNDALTGSAYSKSDYTKFLLRIYFEMNPSVKKDFETRFNNFYNDRAGFFVKGIWSCITLGETDREEYTSQLQVYNAIPVMQSGSKFVLENIPIQGHTSTYLLINGIISMLVLVFFIIVWVWNIKDAYKTSKLYAETKERVSSKEYFKEVYESAFEYIVLLPAVIVIAFISVMPIIFSFLIAFTNYKSNVRLVDWVGLDNFVSIFSFGKTGDITIPFGSVFWKVLVWTIIWAIFSTATVFFGGFLQAMIINNSRVPFKKFWRTVLILPWAIPALISQMMFSIIFKETGIINSILQDIGVYDLFKEIGILGKPYQEYTNSFLKSLYLGQNNIQWFTNPYNKWFVRITLIVVNIWLGFPYYMALMSGIMTSIDKTLYEAAEIDGATKGQQFKQITFPLVMYSTAPLLVMAFSGNFNNFGMIYFVTGGGAHQGDIATAYAGDTDILISWMYSLTVDEKIYNMASVFSILIFVVIGSIAAWNYSQTKAFKED